MSHTSKKSGDDSTWSRIESLFNRAIELPESQQITFLGNHCKREPEIFDEVVSLLNSHKRSDSTGFGSPFSQNLSANLEKLAGKIGGELDALSRSQKPDKAQVEKTGRRLTELNPDFKVIETIASGVSGIVFRVWQNSQSRFVAVKVPVVRDHKIYDDHKLVGKRIADRPFLHEAISVAKIKSRNVVRIHTIRHDEELPFFAMEYISGPSLKQVMEIQKQVAPVDCAQIASQVAAGLAAAHAHGVCHLDVKPSNIMLQDFNLERNRPGTAPERDELWVKLIDFGISRAVAEEGKSGDLDNNPLIPEASKELRGTPAFMSPEQLFDPTKAGPRSDVYGLGVTLYQMLTGEVPFRGEPHMLIRQVKSVKPVAPRELDDSIPPALESICLKAMSKNPDQRHQTADKMRQDLRRFQA